MDQSIKKNLASNWFKTLQNEICSELEFIEEQKTNKITEFTKKIWLRNKNGSDDLGGGEMRLLRGKVFEKAGVNVSTVFGKL